MDWRMYSLPPTRAPTSFYLNQGNWKFEAFQPLPVSGDKTMEYRRGMADLNADGWLIFMFAMPAAWMIPACGATSFHQQP